MNDLREFLEKGITGFEPPEDEALGRTLQRGRRRQRNRRLAAGALGLGLTASLIVALWLVVRPSPRPPLPISPPQPKANGPIWFGVTGEGPSPDYGVWEIEPDGTGLRKVLDFSRANYSQITWSPDGTRIAYVYYLVGHYGIHTSNPDGTAVQRLTDGVNDRWPSWSPDGSRLAFSSTGPGAGACIAGGDALCPNDIYVMATDGTQVTRLTDDPAPEYQPTWSPDGTKIAFARAVIAKAGAYEIDVMASDGANVTPLTVHAGSSPHPSWSPDGKELAFVGGGGVTPGVYEVEADGSGERLVAAETGSFTGGPVWSPDGTKISFVSDRGGVPIPKQCGTDGLCSPQIYLVDPDGTGLKRLTAMPAGVTGIAWRAIP